MPKPVAALDPLPELRCEVCGETVEAVTRRYPPSGLAVGRCCLKLTGAELAVAYGKRLRRIAEGR